MKILIRHKLATLLNVLGLAVVLGAFCLFTPQVIYNYTHNSSIPDAGQMHHVASSISSMVSLWRTCIICCKRCSIPVISMRGGRRNCVEKF